MVARNRAGLQVKSSWGKEYKENVRRGPTNGIPIQTFWTNYSKENRDDYEVLEDRPDSNGYWSFQTNLELLDIQLLTPYEQRSFLSKMLDFYR